LKSTVTFGLIMFFTHFVVDYITSRINARLFEPWYKYISKPDKPVSQFNPTLHNFFVSVGFDQFIHYVIIIGACRFLHVL